MGYVKARMGLAPFLVSQERVNLGVSSGGAAGRGGPVLRPEVQAASWLAIWQEDSCREPRVLQP